MTEKSQRERYLSWFVAETVAGVYPRREKNEREGGFVTVAEGEGASVRQRKGGL